MKAILIGSGDAGRTLASRLCRENHDVVVVDLSAEALAEVEGQLDVLTVQGHGASPRVLAQAGVKGADLLVAVTDRDEVNILACSYGRAAGARNRVARISNPDYLDPSATPAMADFGIDLAVNPKRQCALELAHTLRLPGAQEVVELLDGRAIGAGFVVSSESPLLRSPLRTFPNPELLRRVRFVACSRGGKLAIPDGDTQFQIGDMAYVIGRPADLPAFMDAVYPDHPVIRKVVVGGGGMLGLTLARELEAAGVDVVLVERSERKAERCSAALEKGLVVRGDVMQEDTLGNLGFDARTAFVSATGDDEKNIFSCLLVQKLGVSFTVAQVSRPEYVPVINNLSLLDRVVNPHLSMTRSILHFIRGRHVRSVIPLAGMPCELLEVALAAGHPWAEKAVRELRVPQGAIVVAVQRADEVLVPTGDLELAAGDRLLVFALPDTLKKLEALLRR